MRFLGQREMRKVYAVVGCILSSMAFSCSNTVKFQPHTSFMGHSMGENSMTWSSEESYEETDPLSRCQEVLRSRSLEQSLEPVRSCRDFVNRGAYLINIREPKGSIKKVFVFKNWKLSTFVIKFSSVERERVILELDSQFTKKMPGKIWQGEDGSIIEIQPPDQLSLFTGEPPSDDGFLVVFSDAGP
jgi:hypothetical protein